MAKKLKKYQDAGENTAMKNWLSTADKPKAKPINTKSDNDKKPTAVGKILRSIAPKAYNLPTRKQRKDLEAYEKNKGKKLPDSPIKPIMEKGGSKTKKK